MVLPTPKTNIVFKRNDSQFSFTQYVFRLRSFAEEKSLILLPK